MGSKSEKNGHNPRNFYETMLGMKSETSSEKKQNLNENAEVFEVSENSEVQDEEEVDELSKIMEEPQPQNQQNNPQKKKNVIKLSDTTKLDSKIEELIDKKKGYSQCKICGKNIRGINLMRYHVETHIKGLKFPCDKCSKICKSRDGLRKHQSNPKLCVISNT